MTGTRQEAWSVQTGQRGRDSKGPSLGQGSSQNPSAASSQELRPQLTGHFLAMGSKSGCGALLRAVGVAEAASPAPGPFTGTAISSGVKSPVPSQPR